MSMPDPEAAAPWNAGAGHYFTDEATNSRPILYDNGVFTWPKTFVRTPIGVQHVRRGYMRALSEAGEQHAAVGAGATDGAPPQGASTPAAAGRLHFQFNPSRIQRSVEGRSDVHTWLNMDPYQMTQPIAGQAAFGLELIFNREADVAAAPASMKTIALEDLTSPTAVLSRYAGQIGVLADIYVLDAIIGQGVNSMSLQNIINRARYLAEYGSAASAPATGSTDEQTGGLVPAAPFVWDATAEEELRSRMEGNAAYLIPQPVRIVLSDLFMIDGLVQSSEVIFQKFSPLMIPTLASVTLSVEAMYFGFRRKDTVLTQMWNKPFEKTSAAVSPITGVVGGVTEIANPGGSSGVINRRDPSTDPGTIAIQAKFNEKDPNRKGFFKEWEHHETFKFDDFTPVDKKQNIPTLTQNFNLDMWVRDSAASELMRTNGWTVQSGVIVKLFEYQDASGTWRDATSQKSVTPEMHPTKKDNNSKWTTRGAGNGHVINITPKEGLFSNSTKKLISTHKYRMQLQVFYSVQAGGGSPVRNSARTIWVGPATGSDTINLPRMTYYH